MKDIRVSVAIFNVIRWNYKWSNQGFIFYTWRVLQETRKEYPFGSLEEAKAFANRSKGQGLAVVVSFSYQEDDRVSRTGTCWYSLNGEELHEVR